MDMQKQGGAARKKNFLWKKEQEDMTQKKPNFVF